MSAQLQALLALVALANKAASPALPRLTVRAVPCSGAYGDEPRYVVYSGGFPGHVATTGRQVMVARFRAIETLLRAFVENRGGIAPPPVKLTEVAL